MIDQLYIFLVNKVPGIKERYEAKKKNLKGIGKSKAWLYLIYLNIAYYIFRVKEIGVSKKFPYYEIKKLLSDKTESSAINHLSPEDFAGQLSEYDVISFDVFDTLIFRPFSDPTDLFYLLGNRLNYIDFKRIRTEMEQKARNIKYQKEGHREIDLEDIYALLSAETGVPKQSTMQLELDLEYSTCYPNPYMLQVVKELRAAHKTLIITSDMYLNMQQIKKLLCKCGYENFDSYYISSDIKKSKARGDIYNYIKEKEGLDLSYTHVGDNYTSDYLQADKCGFHAVHYPNINEVGSKYRPEDMSCITGSIYRGLVNSHIYNGFHQYSREYEYGYIYGGIFVTGYCQMIHKYATENQVDKILFLARDGDVLLKAYRQMYPDESDKCEYVYWSRLAATKMGAKYFKYDYFRRFLYHKVNQGYTLIQIMRSMELDDLIYDLCKEKKLSADTKLTDKNVDLIKEFLMKEWDNVLAHYEDQMKAGCQYYKEKLFGARKAVAVDIGWAGSGAIVLDYVVNSVWNLDCPIIGIIAGTNTCYNSEPDATETFLQSKKLISYLYSQRENRDIWKFHNPGKLHNLYWEMLLDSPTGSFKGFYLDTNGHYVCCLKDQQENSFKIKEIHDGILSFVSQYMNIEKNLFPLEDISGRDAYAPMILVESDENAQYIKSMCEIMDEMNVI